MTAFQAVDATPFEGRLPAAALAALRQWLVAGLDVQMENMRDQRRGLAEFTAEPGAALGQFELDWELAEAVAAWSNEAWADIEAALGRIDDGTYGICQDCALPMPLARLEAIPQARYCVRCQEHRDAIR